MGRYLCAFLLTAFLTAAAEDAVIEDEAVYVTWSVPPQRRLQSGHRTGPASIPEELDVEFKFGEQHVQVKLQRNRALLPRRTTHVLHYADGRREKGPLPEACFYTGRVLHGHLAGHASFTTCNGVLSGMLLNDDGTSMVVEPSGRQGRSLRPAGSGGVAGGGSHRVRRLSDEQFEDYRGDVARFVSVKNTSRRLTNCGTKFVEALVVNDVSRYTAFGGQSGLDALALHGVNVMNFVTTLYNAQPTNAANFDCAVQVVLVAQHTFLEADPWKDSDLTFEGSEVDSSSLLDHFNSWAETQMAAGILSDNDNRVLLSGRDFTGNNVGLAGMSAMCDASRSGSVNMCGNEDAAGCAGVVAHEMGHNFGMRHDAGGACPTSGHVMEAVGGGDPPTEFSSCSAGDLNSFLSKTYSINGECLENKPSKVFGDPICGNGFVEDGEDCDCGSSDCSSSDSCCNGNTCKFADASYQCSDLVGECCQSCMIVSAGAKVCRAARNSCDLPEVCNGDSPDCPSDLFVYPGQPCTATDNGKSYPGLCSVGSCKSMDYTCSVDVNRDFDGSWDLSDTCAEYNDACSKVICHDASYPSSPTQCGQYFALHGKQMSIPDGTPCWHPSEPKGARSGMCFLGKCTLPFSLAVVPTCGNGGIDFGEQCDCGSSDDPCCDCSTCQLKSGKACSSHEPCCDASCNFKAKDTVCRAASNSCDVPEVCSGSSGTCPSDVGKPWGTVCTDTDGMDSTCYGKVCVTSMDTQCSVVTDGAKVAAKKDIETGNPSTDSSHDCAALMCCSSCQQFTGNYQVTTSDGQVLDVTDPWMCNGCGSFTSSTSFTSANGEVNTIYLGAAYDGTVLNGKMCMSAALTTLLQESDCKSEEFFEVSVGRCLACSSACSACTGPSNFDCTGACVHGNKDARGACPISAEQVTFAENVRAVPESTSTTTDPTTTLQEAKDATTTSSTSTSSATTSSATTLVDVKSSTTTVQDTSTAKDTTTTLQNAKEDSTTTGQTGEESSTTVQVTKNSTTPLQNAKDSTTTFNSSSDSTTTLQADGVADSASNSGKIGTASASSRPCHLCILCACVVLFIQAIHAMAG